MQNQPTTVGGDRGGFRGFRNMNIPEQIALRDARRDDTSRAGMESRSMYSLSDGRVMYVPLYVEQRILDLAIAPGEPFEICKGEVRDR